MKILINIILLTLTACGPTLIMLKNTKTNEIVKCTGTPASTWAWQAHETKTCAKAYEKNGYEKIL